jgi:hypothetical protein
MTPDEMEVAIRELLEWKASIEKSGTVIIPPETVEPT